MVCLFLFFFCKQKTAYELRISDWSSDVCRQLAGSSRYPKRMKGPAIAGGYLFDERKFFMRFVYDPLPYRVIFGAGTLNQVGEELQHVGRRALLLSTPEQSGSAEELASKLGANAVGTFPQAVMHVPVDTVADAADLATALSAACTVPIRGGTTIVLQQPFSIRLSSPSPAITTPHSS